MLVIDFMRCGIKDVFCFYSVRINKGRWCNIEEDKFQLLPTNEVTVFGVYSVGLHNECAYLQ